ncbi:M20/M25/M40 family metallo-hydrolase [Fluviicola taffensis]|uniref:Peptidase M42 family protein n=1 Tax=Fluviicola taffensis (strain DSM 16823 / NCIMB 13979 / RW262) TaxID=755732 RepID=F2I9M4_FLUTR|nr:M20/M25/M40 family metallo-hydrolase [Fluviicola taffensis]AEA42017.1 peptidase M42 family protein [Fluviicola taffensis DSM 16823]
MELSNSQLLQELISIQGLASDESRIKSFVKEYVLKNSSAWKTKPHIIDGLGFQDALILVFGNPRTAVYAHMDTIGYSVGYENELIRVGGPKNIDGTILVGSDSNGEVEGELMIFEDEYNQQRIQLMSDRVIDRGTLLSFKPNFKETKEYIQSPYMDNRLGVFVALQLAETMENGAIVFSTYEEHGGNSVGACAKYLLNNYDVFQALICDITWVTHGVVHKGGVAVSMRDSMLPRRKYLNKILSIARESGVKYQLEVESAGGSDGSVLQKSDLPIDWCFIGAPEDNVHTPQEKVYKKDIESMIDLYKVLMDKL